MSKITGPQTILSAYSHACWSSSSGSIIRIYSSSPSSAAWKGAPWGSWSHSSCSLPSVLRRGPTSSCWGGGDLGWTQSWKTGRGPAKTTKGSLLVPKYSLQWMEMSGMLHRVLAQHQVRRIRYQMNLEVME